jgi:putative addiction module component (TIGR02574 family)
MPDLVAELASQARSLPVEDRSRLVDLLLESLHESPIAEVEAAWTKEIERRVAAYERGEVETFTAEDVFAEARRIAS